MNASAAARCCGRSKAIVACFVPTARYHVRRFRQNVRATPARLPAVPDRETVTDDSQGVPAGDDAGARAPLGDGSRLAQGRGETERATSHPAPWVSVHFLARMVNSVSHQARSGRSEEASPGQSALGHRPQGQPACRDRDARGRPGRGRHCNQPRARWLWSPITGKGPSRGPIEAGEERREQGRQNCVAAAMSAQPTARGK
jgi:hypothetical protein